MASKYGPYTAVAPPIPAFGWQIKDGAGIHVVDFLNGNPTRVEFFSPPSDLGLGERNATAIATNLSNDDTAYLALVSAHFTGGAVSITGTGGAAAIGFVNQAINNLSLIVSTLPSAEATALSSAKTELFRAISVMS